VRLPKSITLTIGAMLLITASPAKPEPIITGFLQGLYGGGLEDDNPTSSDWTASETRLQLRAESYSESAEFFGRLDFTYDDFNDPNVKADLREGYIKFRPGSRFDVKIGRQIATWGTGDLIFINDLFAKDYRSFFIGRDDQYLKAPHNALRVEFYSDLVNLTAIYTPRFTPNIIPTGERLSYFNPMVGDIVGGKAYLFEGIMPEATIENGEIAARMSRYFGAADFALYFYNGFYKNPVGIDMVNMRAFYPQLSVYGGSVRLPVFGGIAWVETGLYHSREDKKGDNPLIPNSSISSLAGFERQIATDLTANIQYQNKIMLDHDAYLESLPPGMVEMDETYHLVTSRITKLLLMETLTLSGFVFYSPSEEDLYARLSTSYKYTDALSLAVGGNIFDGDKEYTDFGAFQKNDNLYIKVTYGY
jgi:hypothetical protein